MTDTIFALATSPGRAAIAVVRISGTGTRAMLEEIAGGVPAPRHAAHRRLRDPKSGEIIDDAIVLFFAAPQSFTGEDMAELQLHSGRAILATIFATLCARAGFRLAEPGEFTRRAFVNEKLDLTAAE